MSKASAIAVEITSRLQGISIANGYATNIGARVYRGKLRLDETNLPCVVLVEGDDDSGSQQIKNCRTEAVYMLEGHAVCDPDNPNDVGHLIVADLKKAIFSGDITFNKTVLECRYAGRSIEPREAGLSLVAASIEISVTFVENLASP